MKQYTIVASRHSYNGNIRNTEYTGTVPELVNTFSYTLLCGHSYEHERGNRKINMNPKTIRSLLTNLNNAESNRSANGSRTSYWLKEA